MNAFGQYRVADPDALETPAMLLYPEIMHHNIRSVCELAGGGHNLMVHVKTHKSEAVARKQVEAGIHGFKCATLKELEMVLHAGARKAILAFPQGQERKVERLCDLISAFPDAWVATIVSKPHHVELLSTVATRRKQSLRAMLGYDDAEFVLQSEEHGVFRIAGELPSVGDYLLAVPGHICTTTVLYPGIHVIDTAGELVDYYDHTARDRI